MVLYNCNFGSSVLNQTFSSPTLSFFKEPTLDRWPGVQQPLSWRPAEAGFASQRVVQATPPASQYAGGHRAAARRGVFALSAVHVGMAVGKLTGGLTNDQWQSGRLCRETSGTVNGAPFTA